MIKNKTVTAILLVAGNSTRFGQNRNKNFESICEKTIMSYSLNAFDKNQYVDDMIVVAKESEKEKVQNIVKQENVTKPVHIVCGGNSRQESVYHGLQATNAEIVIVHDGARPAIKQEYINQCIESMEEFQGVTVGVKSKDTIKITDENGVIVSSTKRSNTWIIQTPQCFHREILLKMHEKYKNEEVTDDCMLLEMNGYQLKVLESDYTNIKVTTYEDLGIVEQFVK